MVQSTSDPTQETGMDFSISLGGLQAAWRSMDRAAAALARSGAAEIRPPERPGSEAASMVPPAPKTDPVEASVELLAARLAARANRNALRAQAELADEITRLGKR
jgi:hypothetical protein